MEDKYHDQALPAESPIVSAYLGLRALPPVAIGAYGLLPKTAKTFITEKALEHGLPFYKALDKVKDYIKMGEKYYKENIQPYQEHNSTFGNDYYYPGNSSGKTYYEYMNQYPTLRKNTREAQEFIYLDNNKPRTDANGFDNLKVNFKGDDYAYQFKNNAYNQHKEFHNIKPYSLVEEELKGKMPKSLYDALMNE